MRHARRRALVSGLLAGVALACARPGTPRGGVEDRRPPAVIEAEPTPLARVDDPGAAIRFRFSERISERPSRGTLDEAVMVSPQTGAVRVEHGSEGLEVMLAGGLRPGLVYRVTVLPVIVDLFGNRMTDPFEIVFSTGGSLDENAIAGQVLDRITGRPTPEALVALFPVNPVPDTIPYFARSDQAGLFFFRYVPQGRYNLVAFEDRNRNLTPDLRTETSGGRGVLIQARDTLITDVTLLAPDTSAAGLLRAEIVDSLTLRLVFTDYLDPAAAAQTSVVLSTLDGDPGAAVTRVLHPVAWEALRDSLAAAADTSRAAVQRRESRVPLPGQTVAPPGQERGGLPAGVPLPRQELVAVLAPPLEVGRSYRVTVLGVLNLNGVPLGGGQDTIVRAPGPRPTRADTLAAPRGGLDAPADTIVEPADTSRLGFRGRADPRRRR